MIVRRIMKYAAPDANLEQYATANIHRSMIFYWDTVLVSFEVASVHLRCFIYDKVIHTQSLIKSWSTF